MGFVAFAGGVSVSHAYAHLVEVGVEVALAGLHVAPGDVLHGDEHGLLAVPEDLVELLPAVAEAIVAEERAVLAWADSADFSAARILERLAAVSARAVAASRGGEQAPGPA